MKIWFFLLTLATFIYANDGACCAQNVQTSYGEELPQILEPVCETNGADLEVAMRALKRGQFDIAVGIFQTLAEQGNFLAQQNLGVMYNNGFGIAKNKKLASYWFCKAQEGLQNDSVNCSLSPQSLDNKHFIFKRVCMK